MVVALVLYLGLAHSDPASGETGVVSDASAVCPYAGALEFLVHEQIISGYQDGQVRPNDPISRQQFAKIMVLALQVPVSEADVCGFTDVQSSDDADLYPDNYIAACATHRITQGTSPGCPLPREEITRAIGHYHDRASHR